MNSYSQLVLMWLFGRWIFDDGELASNVAAQTVTPLTIFASAFSTLGMAMFGVLGAWAIFLGIFRLKNNGNFFGSRDGNEAFFYPLRMVMAMTLCAPVIPVASAGGVAINLTPGHALVAGIAKSAAEFGDYMQRNAFELMHRHNLFADPQFKVRVDPQSVFTMLNTWKQPAVQLAGAVVFRDANKVLSNASIDQIAMEALRIRWNQAQPANAVQYELSVPAVRYITARMGSINVPLIAPSDDLAAALSNGIGNVVDADAALGTVDLELGSEGWLCRRDGGGDDWMSTTVCSDEYLAVKKNNAASIEKAIASAQRTLWQGMVNASYAQAVSVLRTAETEEEVEALIAEAETLAVEAARYVPEAAQWYAQTVEEHIRATIAGDQAARSEIYFEEVKNWGWMLGGTFVLRAASDFSRAASFAEGATAQMMPPSNLAILTTGDVMSKMVEQQVMSQQTAMALPENQSLLNSFFHLDELKNETGPSAQNLHNIAAWGRFLVGSGIGVWAGGATGLVDKLPVVRNVIDSPLLKSIGVVMITAGGLLGYVMPLLFAVYGLMGAISWLVAVATTFFGITLWSAGMAAPKGEEHTSQLSAKGYNALIFIGLYPALAVGGLAAAIVISAVGLSMTMMFALGLWGMFDPGTAEIGRPLESIGGMLIGAALLVLVVVIICWNVVATSAQLITTFPRTVLNMIALSEPGLNPYDNNVQGIMGGLSMSGRQVLTGAASRLLSARTGSRSVGEVAGGH